MINILGLVNNVNVSGNNIKTSIIGGEIGGGRKK
jgi:hypothetical protein